MKRIGSLFSGAGGLDVAVESVFEGHVVWHSEINESANSVLKHRFPEVPNHGSITNVNWSKVERVDILCGGFPCQDVSFAGVRAGMITGSRSGLWAEFAIAIEALNPETVIIENVRGLLSAKSPTPGMKAIDAVLCDLTTLGYGSQRIVVPAAAVGAPHRRDRVFIVAKPGGEHLDVTPIRRSPTKRPLLPTCRTLDASDIRGRTKKRSAEDNHRAGRSLTDIIRELTLLPTPAVADADGTRATRGGSRSNELLLNGIARAVTEFGKPVWGKYQAAIDQWTKLTRPAPYPIEMSIKGNRRLAPSFSEWMMGWPEGWVTDPEFSFSRSEMLRLIGNGVVTRQAEYALRELTIR